VKFTPEQATKVKFTLEQATKVKFTPEQATKAQRWSRGIAVLFLLTLALYGGGC
jgi:hypothetical protein